jgi:outer membrane protein OmpA-like peptidoglycan-associated protein
MFMKVVHKVSFVVPVLLAFLVVFMPCSFAEQDVPEGKDHPLLSRMPGYFIRGYSQSDFDSFEFTGKDGKPMVMEGRKTVIEYKISEGAKQASPIQIFRNCQNALAKNGGKVIYEVIEQAAFGKTTLTLAKGGQEAWINVDVGNRGEIYNVTIIEKQGMKQDVVSAATWRDEIRSTGHTAVYGIYFDTDKAELKPESDAALQEIAKLLGQDASLRLMVVGHTDLAGDITHNMQLSERRAKAVLTALTTRFKIAPPRLTAYGVGPLCPVAPNDTEEGRARNRRVELVKR